jgi:hypothetical protein
LQVILTKEVTRWLKRQRYVSAEALVHASAEVVQGTHEASLGGNLFKKRIASTPNKGKSGGSRLIVAFKSGNDIFILFAFDKNDKENISPQEKKALLLAAESLFTLDSADIEKAIEAKMLTIIGEIL